MLTGKEYIMENQVEVKSTHDIKAITMLISAMALAGSSVVVGKIVIYSVPVFLGAFSSLLVAFFCMIPLMLGRTHELRKLTRTQWKYLFLQGLCGIVLFRVFTLYGLHSTGAVQAGIITGTMPAVLAFLSFFLLKEHLGIRALCGITFAVSGCVVINIFTAETGDAGNSITGCILVGAAVVCEALFTIFRKRIAHSVSATTNTTVLIFCSLMLLVIPATVDLTAMKELPHLNTFIAIAYYGVFATVIAYLLWTSAVAKVDGAVAGATTAAMPASSVILAVLVLGEQVHWYHFVGCVMIIAGIFVTSAKKKS